jgi:hypothetical protein
LTYDEPRVGRALRLAGHNQIRLPVDRQVEEQIEVRLQ